VLAEGRSSVSTLLRNYRELLSIGVHGVGVAIERQTYACISGLLCGWSALFIAVWVGAVLGVLGAIGGFFAIGLLSFGFAGASQGFAVLGALGGFGAGFAVGFLSIFGGSIASAPDHVVAAMLVGGICAFLMTLICLVFEGTFLDFRQFRRPSRRAQEGALTPLLDEVRARMGYSSRPQLRIADVPLPGAWTHVRHIVLSKGLLEQMDQDEIAAVMSHELHHWAARDALAMRFVWGCALPLVLLANAYARVCVPITSRPRWASLFAMVAWPAVALLQLVVASAMMSEGRKQEYEADAAAIAAGYGPALASALSKLKDFEIARTGWEGALLRTHPPIEFRLEAIEEAVAAERTPRTTAASKAGRATTRRSRGPVRSSGSA